MRAFSRLLLIGACLCMALTTAAQVPGFMGRRNMLRADLFFMPASPSRYRNPSTPSGNPGFFVHNTKGVGYERVVSRRMVVGLDADLTRLGCSAYISSIRGRIHANIWGVGFRFRSYPFLRKGWIAPLGPYFGMSLRAMVINQSFHPDGSQSIRDYTRGSGIGESIMLLFGHTSALSERFLLDVGGRFGFTDTYHNLDTYDINRENLFLSDMFKLHLGLSFML